MAEIKHYRDLTTWQKSMDLVVEIYRLSKRFPTDEQWGLSSQIRRAAVSIPANIAEGNGRLHRADYVRFLSITTAAVIRKLVNWRKYHARGSDHMAVQLGANHSYRFSPIR